MMFPKDWWPGEGFFGFAEGYGGWRCYPVVFPIYLLLLLLTNNIIFLKILKKIEEKKKRKYIILFFYFIFFVFSFSFIIPVCNYFLLIEEVPFDSRQRIWYPIHCSSWRWPSFANYNNIYISQFPYSIGEVDGAKNMWWMAIDDMNESDGYLIMLI